jgi:AAA15 family ATPase/GTPase
MLETLEIENFRCFEKLKVEGLKRINLIGGMNNAGKTALLEAIYLMLERDIKRLLDGRRITEEQIANLEELFYRHFFYCENVEHVIRLKARVSDFEKIISSSLRLGSFQVNNQKVLRQGDDLGKRSYSFDPDSKKLSTTMEAEPLLDGASQLNYPKLKCTLLLPNEPRHDVNMARDYDRSFIGGTSDLILEIMQQVEPEVVEIRSLNIGVPRIHLRKKNGSVHPISMYGDAVNRVMEMVLTIINNKDSVLLIDEIENGIHYTRQPEFWRLLSQLAETFNVQIFATTHSREMLEAFSKTFGTDGDAVYFEMARHAKSNQISAIRHRLELLEHELEQDLEIRGE